MTPKHTRTRKDNLGVPSERGQWYIYAAARTDSSQFANHKITEMSNEYDSLWDRRADVRHSIAGSEASQDGRLAELRYQHREIDHRMMHMEDDSQHCSYLNTSWCLRLNEREQYSSEKSKDDAFPLYCLNGQ